MKVAYVGPSLADAAGQEGVRRARIEGLAVRPPATGGDILRAVEEGAVAVALIDGQFGSTESVHHKELLYALSLGIRIVGAASMGALRAVECASFGMVGLGTIYARYASGELDADDAVALAYGPAELGYRGLSEPLVTIESNLLAMVVFGILEQEQAARMIAKVRQVHYRERSLTRVLDTLEGPVRQRALDWLTVHRRDPKRDDALLALQWLLDAPDRPGDRSDWRMAETASWIRIKQKALTVSL
ncbi:TfuA-like protein [Thalassobaculum sp.]|uniref:TfuA-like protein n=1 Tax=Thalassobaculum sp. TaxID=2022740 RepID=UPI0032F023FB